jgi:nucleoside-diphosphate kinase
MVQPINYNQVTFSILKPEVVAQNLDGKINGMLQDNGFRILLQKKIHMTLSQAEFFYQEHKERPFFKDLTLFLSSGPVVVQILWSQEDTVKKYRDIMGATNPANAADNTIRKSYGHSIDYNAVHGSDSPISSQRECLCFFTETEINGALNSNSIKVADIMKKA